MADTPHLPQHRYKMAYLKHQRCHLHRDREAVARCPECNRYYCRECITEHEDRMLCATCLGRIPDSRNTTRFQQLYWLIPFLQLGGGLLLLWVVFYYIGNFLSLLPTAFHEGTFWELGG